ncbi:hypothetical protein HAPAU_30990 [Halalkalicoccus paucihalophilus]|uniref:Uncharacterized protein n=1 Tax=Halalkalicoccus paucihalophilus TaxID=1008153 RepID=A0A151AAT2_9EURY|nr:hypothetical protein HAPAU_30990 [Halalkalicoccus paucihalophilus]
MTASCNRASGWISIVRHPSTSDIANGVNGYIQSSLVEFLNQVFSGLPVSFRSSQNRSTISLFDRYHPELGGLHDIRAKSIPIDILVEMLIHSSVHDMVKHGFF